ncbi:MAG: hypothetical protein ACRDD7_08310 [Peptostreptococcaceae bacterium]
MKDRLQIIKELEEQTIIFRDKNNSISIRLDAARTLLELHDKLKGINYQE